MNAYLAAFLIVMAVILAALFVLGLCGWSARRQAKRKTPRRVRPEREQAIDLAGERWAYCSARDSRMEAHQLRRAG